jgi:hypothetical protein
VWIPNIKGFPTCQIGVFTEDQDPLSGPTALTSKVLAILRSKPGPFRKQAILDVLSAEGMGKEIIPAREEVAQALQRLKRQGFAQSVGWDWMATSHLQEGAM